MMSPSCWPGGEPCPNACAHQHYQRTVYTRRSTGRGIAGAWPAAAWCRRPADVPFNKLRIDSQRHERAALLRRNPSNGARRRGGPCHLSAKRLSRFLGS